MQLTDFIFLAYFDFGDELDSPLNVQAEIDRFVVIDRQLYGYYKIFGDGVIDGWTVNSSTGLAITVDPGVGIINSLAAETSFSETIVDLPPNAIVNIYAIINKNTVLNRDVTFDFTTGTLTDGSLLLATVTTGGIAIQSVDNTVRTKIGFKTIIDQEIAKHRHDGISAPKIDLSSEVQGLLPSDRLDNVDASLVSGGKLPQNVLPAIDHSTLKNIGTLTHPQLDSFAKSIQNDNVALMGEIALINQLKSIVYHKNIDPDYDKTLENELTIIPGISPSSHIDYTQSNANITDSCISGLPAIPSIESATGEVTELISSGNLQIINVSYDKDSDFIAAPVKTNVAISEGVRLSTDTVFDRIIESFDDGVAGNAIPGWTTNLSDINTTTATYEQSAAQGALAAKFQTSNSRTLQATKTFSVPQDWTTYDTLVVFVKNFGATHSAVSLQILDSDNTTVLATYVLLAADEITVYANPDTAGYAKKEFSISFTRSKIGGLRLVTDTISNDLEAFYIDTIYLKSSEFLLPQGNLRLRYQSAAPVIFNAVEYVANVPSGADVRVRVRVANTLNDLVNAAFTPLLLSGEVFGLPGQVIEIDVTLISDSARQFSPDLTAVYLSLLVPSQISGLSIGDVNEWNRGEKLNISVDDTGVVALDKANIGNFYFINQGYVNELDPTLVPVAGIRGDLMPIAPYQGFNAITPQTVNEYDPTRSFLIGLYQPKSAYRLNTGNYLIADTGNDRVIEVADDGTFVRGFASHNNTYSDQLFALTANYNPRLGVLFITFSADFDITTVDLTKITLSVGTNQSITLDNASDMVRTLKGDVLTNRNGSTGVLDKTLSVVLSADKQKILNTTASPVGVKILNDVNLNAIPCFIGDYMYFAQYGLKSPIYVNESSETQWIVANARVTSFDENIAPDGTPSVLEFDKSTGEMSNGQMLGATFVYNGIIFSDIALGSLQMYTESLGGVTQRKLLMAGLTYPLGQVPQASSSSSGGGGLGSSDTTKLQNFVGTVLLIDMDSQLISFRYNSPDGLYPSDVTIDNDGFYVIAESSMVDQSGRIVTLDQNGNVIKLIEGGVFTKINDIRLLNEHLFVST